MWKYIAKYFNRWSDVGNEILEQKIVNGVDPKYSEDFAKFLKDFKKKYDIIEGPRDERLDVEYSEDSDPEDEYDNEHGISYRTDKLMREGYTIDDIMKMDRDKWHGIKANKTNWFVTIEIILEIKIADVVSQ